MSNQSKRQHYDDLTKIRGIGQATQQWLRENLAVYSFQDLANLSVVELEQALKADGRIPSVSRIEQWLSQATELASAKLTMSIPFDEDVPTASRRRRVATFVVVFEESTTQTGKYLTNVHHMEADVTYSWDKVVKQELGEWIIQQMGAEIAALADVDYQPVAESIAIVTNPPVAAPSQLITTADDSDKMAHYIAKADALSQQSALLPQPAQAEPLPTKQETVQLNKMQPDTASVNPAPIQPNQQNMPDEVASLLNAENVQYSPKMQAYINKVKALSLRQSD